MACCKWIEDLIRQKRQDAIIYKICAVCGIAQDLNVTTVKYCQRRHWMIVCRDCTNSFQIEFCSEHAARTCIFCGAHSPMNNCCEKCAER